MFITFLLQTLCRMVLGMASNLGISRHIFTLCNECIYVLEMCATYMDVIGLECSRYYLQQFFRCDKVCYILHYIVWQ